MAGIRKPLETGYLDVGSGYKLHYELWGNSKGKLIVKNNGGPGGKIKPHHKKQFNLKKHCVLLYDQRGCGQSQYTQLLKNNTTQYLVEDIKKLIEHVGYSKAIMAGGSFGSFLSLNFAIAYPQMVSELRIGGIYLGTKDEIDYREILARQFPYFHEKLVQSYGESYLDVLFERILTKKDVAAVRDLVCSEIGLMTPDFDLQKMQDVPFECKSENLIFAHFMSNEHFLSSKFIEKNLSTISHIKTTIVHGTFDLLCAPKYAYLVAKYMDDCRLHFVKGGHFESERESYATLEKTYQRMYRK